MNNGISIILVNYNSFELTRQCIDSIYMQIKDEDIEIIVVDNCSSDSSLEKLDKIFPSIKLIRSKENSGFGRANNLGVQSSTKEYIFLLNADTILHNDPFPFFFYLFEKYKDIGIAGALLTNKDGGNSLSGGNTYSIRKYLRLALKRYKYRILHKRIDFTEQEVDFNKQEQQVDYVIGADMFLKRELFLEAGGFDPHIFMYFEDVEFCHRVSDMGYKMWLTAGPSITHLEGSGNKKTEFQRLHNTASLMYCMRKKYNIFEFRLFQIAFFILKFPLIFEKGKQKENWQYLLTIFQYNRYLLN